MQMPIPFIHSFILPACAFTCLDIETASAATAAADTPLVAEGATETNDGLFVPAPLSAMAVVAPAKKPAVIKNALLLGHVS